MLAAGCGVSRSNRSDTAATIEFSDGSQSEITADELSDVLGAVLSEPEFVELAYGEAPAEDIERDMLTRLIQRETVAHLRAEAGATVADGALEEVRGILDEQLVGFFEDDAESMSESLAPFLGLLAVTSAEQEALGEALIAEAGDVPCASHILVDDPDLADELLAELEDGGDFAALAIEHSLDPGSGAQGGELGCADPSLYVPEFAEAITAATEGEVVGPVATQFGFHLIVVTGYEPVDPATVDANTLAFTAAQAELAALVATIDLEIGLWDPQSQSVIGIGN